MKDTCLGGKDSYFLWYFPQPSDSGGCATAWCLILHIIGHQMPCRRHGEFNIVLGILIGTRKRRSTCSVVITVRRSLLLAGYTKTWLTTTLPCLSLLCMPSVTSSTWSTAFCLDYDTLPSSLLCNKQSEKYSNCTCWDLTSSNNHVLLKTALYIFSQ